MDPTIIGGALGAIARFAPEVLNFFDRKDRRKHEALMADKAQRGEQIKSDGEFRNTAVGALQTAITTQGQVTGVKWVDAINALVRPVITFQWVIVLYPAALIIQWVSIFQEMGGGLSGAVAATARVFGPEEKALCSFIVNFWFLGRVLDKAGAVK